MLVTIGSGGVGVTLVEAVGVSVGDWLLKGES